MIWQLVLVPKSVRFRMRAMLSWRRSSSMYSARNATMYASLSREPGVGAESTGGSAAPTVSREHCAIEHQGVDLVLRDLDSTGGTFVAGDRVTSVPVRNGLEVTVGPAVLKFLDGGD